MKTTLNTFTKVLLFFLAWPLFQFCGCGGDDIVIPEFDGERAFGYIEKQVSFGPRIPGSENSGNCREYLMAFFDSLGATVDTMSFIHVNKFSGEEVPMVNVIAGFEGTDQKSSKKYLLAAHYDSRPRAEYDPDTTKRENWIAGANDGASGVALLMELGNLFASRRPRVSIDMALLDGEDYGPPGHLDEYFLGAREMVRRNIGGKYEFALIIDMIGDRDLKVYREEFSNRYAPQLTDYVWDIAAGIGEDVFVDSVGYAVHDDHLSFLTIRLPSVVIIDFNYDYWHTTHDTPDKCSPKSLRSVGRVVSTLLYKL
jgi:glutaminyl-peptide cyclotransferase